MCWGSGWGVVECVVNSWEGGWGGGWEVNHYSHVSNDSSEFMIAINSVRQATMFSS